MALKIFLCVLIVGAYVACSNSEEQLPSGPPIAVAYETACDSTNHQKLVILEGYLDLFPRLLSCYPDENARTGRSCQVKLLPAPDAPTESATEDRAYYTLFIDEGDRSGEAKSRGYGFGPPLTVFTADSTVVDPYDKVRATGRLHSREPVGGGAELICTIDISQIEIAEAAIVSWADEIDAERAALQARVDSMAALREQRDHEHPPVE